MPNCVHELTSVSARHVRAQADTIARRRRSIQMHAADRQPQTPAELESYEAGVPADGLSSQKEGPQGRGERGR